VRILILSDRFTPEIAAPSFRILDHARVWLDLGHEVTVVTCTPNFPHGVVFPGYRNRLYQEEWIDGLRVIRIWTYMAANEGVVRRTLDYMSYMFSAIFFAWRYPTFDVLLATSPPFFAAIAGWVVAGLRRRPWVFEIRDLWPASIRAVGASRSRALDLVERLELFLYRKADRIISLTQSFRRDLASRGIPVEKNDVVTNAVDLRQFGPEQVRFDARERLCIPKDAFLAGYIGTTGLAHDLEKVLDAADRCRDEARLCFLIMGEGAKRAELEAEARRRELSNVVFHDFVPHDDVPSVLAALDVSLIHLRPDPVFRTVIPSKMFESMAMGIPMIMAVEGESAALVTDAGAGICVPSGDGAAIAEAVRRLAAEPALAAKLGQRGRTAAESKYSRRPNAEAALRTLLAAVQSYTGGGTS